MEKSPILLLTFFATCVTVSVSLQPNIVFIIADDLGFNDVGFNNPNMVTPNMDNLAKNGVIVDQSYMQPVCTPSRSALMSGKFPFRTGLQHGTIGSSQPLCLPLDLKILPQKLKELGYSTHLIGKWHLGFCKEDCLPNKRGFDTFFGFYNGGGDHYKHTSGRFLDLHDNGKPVRTETNVYSTHLFTDKAIEYIDKHDASKPLFIDLSYQAPHSPIQVPDDYLKYYPNVTSTNRKQYMAMVTAMDQGIGNIVKALKAKGIYDNTLIIFSSDNGGDSASGNNYPLRGTKGTVYEGGTRIPAFVHGKAVIKTNYRNTGMMHVVDWYSTIIGLAGGVVDKGVDGVDQSDMLLKGTPSKRSELIYNLDNYVEAGARTSPLGYTGAIRVGDYKLILGNYARNAGWYPPPEFGSDFKGEEASSGGPRQLFNLKDDPYEKNNLFKSNPSKGRELKAKMDKYYKEAVTPTVPADDDRANPRNFGNVYSPGWC